LEVHTTYPFGFPGGFLLIACRWRYTAENPFEYIGPHVRERRTPMRSLKWILLGVYLIIAGLALLGVSLGGGIVDTFAGICAVVAGVLFLLNR
jgi:hypothetical protein